MNDFLVSWHAIDKNKYDLGFFLFGVTASGKFGCQE